MQSSKHLVMAVVMVAGFGVGVFSGCQAGDPAPRGGKAVQPRQQGVGGAMPVSTVAVTDISPTRAREKAIDIIERAFKGDDAALRANAVEAAGVAPNRFGDMLRASLTDTNAGVRAVGLMQMGKVRDATQKEVMRSLTRDKSATVQASAIYALTRIGESPDQTPLASALLEHEVAWASRYAAYVIGEIGNPSALPLLQNADHHRVATLPPAQQRIFQIQLAESMVKLGDESQRAVLRAALYPNQPEEFEVAAMAAQALGETKDREAVAQLVSVNEYRTRTGEAYPPEVRLAVATALGKLGFDGATGVADEFVASKTASLRAQAAHAYGATGNAAMLPKVAVLLDDPDPVVKVSAAMAVLKCTR